MTSQQANWGPVPFKVYNTWLKDKNLQDLVNKHLELTRADTNSNIHSILKSLRGKIKDWSKMDRNNIDVKIKEVEKCIEDVDKGARGNQSLVDLNRTLEGLYDRKVEMIRQKARVNWALQGEKNSKFYHQCITRRHCRNLIRKIYWENVWYSSATKLKEVFFKFFSKLFDGSKAFITFKLGSLSCSKISLEEA